MSTYESITPRELRRAALVCALLAALFLSPALLTGRYLSPADMLLDSYPWREVRPLDWQGASNNLLVDSAVQHEPWLMYSTKRLREGSLPLWNPDNMLGAPLLGNMQSGVFYPLNWPYLIWPDPLMLWVRAWLKLVIAALGMYVLARGLARTGQSGAWVAVITFTFGAFMTVWLLHPPTAALIWLPWIWWATARLVERPGARGAGLLAALVGVDMLAGHPETVYHMGQATAVFMLFHIWQTGPLSVSRVGRIGGWWSGAYLLGLLVSSVQLLPFLEYSQLSVAVLRRTERQIAPFFVPFHYAWTAFSPDLFGNPALKTQWGAPVSYNEANNYSGVFPLVLAPFAFLVPDRKQRRLGIFLAITVLVSLGIVHGWPLVSDAALLVPGMRLVLNNRMVMLIEFALALLAGLGVQGMTALLPERRRLFTWVLGVTVTVIMLVGVAVPALFMHSFFEVLQGSGLASRVWSEGLWRAGLLVVLCGGTLALVSTLWKKPHRLALALWLIPALLLADLWQAHIIYMPVTDPAQYFPRTAATDFLRGREGIFRVSAGQGVLSPNTNLAYGLADLRGYDAIESQLYYHLTAWGDPAARQLSTGGFYPSPLLNLLNVRYVISPPGDDPNYAVDVRQEVNTEPVGEIMGDYRPGQDFIAQTENLAGIQVLGATFGGRAEGKLFFNLSESPISSTIITQELDARQLPDNSYWTITFPPIRGVRGRHFYFSFSAPDANSGKAATLWYNNADAYPDGKRMGGTKSAPGDITFRTLTAIDPNAPRFERVVDGGYTRASVYENLRVLPRAWIAHRVMVEANSDKLIGRLYDPAFDVRGTVLLPEALSGSQSLTGSPAAEDDAVTITRYEPEDVGIKAASREAGLLVLSDLAFPGWEAEIDGRQATILRADHALRAVYLTSGAHNVRFVYRPQSFRIGALLSIGVLVVIGLLGWWPVRGRRTWSVLRKRS